jgi:hypothetical protein
MASEKPLAPPADNAKCSSQVREDVPVAGAAAAAGATPATASDPAKVQAAATVQDTAKTREERQAMAYPSKTVNALVRMFGNVECYVDQDDHDLIMPRSNETMRDVKTLNYPIAVFVYDGYACKDPCWKVVGQCVAHSFKEYIAAIYKLGQSTSEGRYSHEILAAHPDDIRNGITSAVNAYWAWKA